MKELKKKHSPRPVGGAETGSQGGEDLKQSGSHRARVVRQQLADWARKQLLNQAVPHLHADKLGGTTGEQVRLHNPGLQHGEIMPQHL